MSPTIKSRPTVLRSKRLTKLLITSPLLVEPYHLPPMLSRYVGRRGLLGKPCGPALYDFRRGLPVLWAGVLRRVENPPRAEIAQRHAVAGHLPGGFGVPVSACGAGHACAPPNRSRVRLSRHASDARPRRFGSTRPALRAHTLPKGWVPMTTAGEKVTRPQRAQRLLGLVITPPVQKMGSRGLSKTRRA